MSVPDHEQCWLALKAMLVERARPKAGGGEGKTSWSEREVRDAMDRIEVDPRYHLPEGQEGFDARPSRPSVRLASVLSGEG